MKVATSTQARAGQTLTRLLDAAEALLEARPLEEISVRDVLGKSGVSTGSFYARFDEKDALIQATLQRFLARGIEPAHQLEALNLGKRSTIKLALEGAINGYRRHRGLLSALEAFVRARPESELAQARQAAALAARRWWSALLCASPDGSPPIDSEEAEFAGRFISEGLRGGYMLNRDDPWAGLSTSDMAERLMRMLEGLINQSNQGTSTA